MPKATVHLQREGERLSAGNSEILIKATAEETSGSFFLSETTVEPRFAGPPLHRHDHMHDMFYVLDGALEMRLGEDTLTAEPGTFVCVPPGVAHTFSNPSASPVRFLNFSTPAGWERYMRDLAAAAADGPLTPEKIGPIASRYDFKLA
jgi:quercetin dioxygenase-like cupin family protein